MTGSAWRTREGPFQLATGRSTTGTSSSRRKRRAGLSLGDVVFLATLVAFFGLAALLVRGCDRIIGPDEAAPRPAEADKAGPGTEMAA